MLVRHTKKPRTFRYAPDGKEPEIGNVVEVSDGLGRRLVKRGWGDEVLGDGRETSVIEDKDEEPEEAEEE